jgi:hypothetical protein
MKWMSSNAAVHLNAAAHLNPQWNHHHHLLPPIHPCWVYAAAHLHQMMMVLLMRMKHHRHNAEVVSGHAQSLNSRRSQKLDDREEVLFHLGYNLMLCNMGSILWHIQIHYLLFSYIFVWTTSTGSL